MITTWEKVFNAVCADMEKVGELPDILDYHLAPNSAKDVPYDTDNMSVPYARLDYGGSEGIYLTLHVFDETRKLVRVGTFKTLYDGEDDIEEMSKLLGRFINALYRWTIDAERRKKDA